MSDPTTPEWRELGIPEDDAAEPADAQVEHTATAEEIERLLQEDEV